MIETAGVSLRNAIPTASDYQALLDSGLFRELESFSDAFLKDNEVALRPYASQWVADPLHQWSRQWEYPFVFERASRLFDRGIYRFSMPRAARVSFLTISLPCSRGRG